MLLSAFRKNVISAKWVLILSLALFLAQLVRLHIHTFDHDYPAHPEAEISGHNSIAALHLVTDQSHADHHEGAILEVETTPSVLAKNASNLLPFLALLSGFFLIIFLVQPVFRIKSVSEDRVPLSDRSSLTPPLRAPPFVTAI